MGISLLSCYHGAQIFEIYGLGKEVVDAAFFGSVSRIGGLSLAEVQREAESFWVKVLPRGRCYPCNPPPPPLCSESRDPVLWHGVVSWSLTES